MTHLLFNSICAVKLVYLSQSGSKLMFKCFPRLLLLLLFISKVDAGNDKQVSCNLNNLNNSSVSFNLKQYAGQVIYLDFWASWCAPCAKSFPFMNKLKKKFEKDGLKVIAVNLDEDLNEASNFLAKVPAKFTVVSDKEQKCAKALNVQAMPSTYVIDKQGVVRHIHLGFREGETNKLQMVVEQLLAE